MIEGGSSRGSIGMEMGAPAAVMSMGAEVGAMASGGVLAQATAVAEQAWGVNPPSALDAAQAAMHSTAREAWAATEPAPVSVLSPQVTAMLAFTGLQAQIHHDSPQDLTLAPVLEVAPKPYSVIDEASSVVESVLSKPTVHVLSPIEALGLMSVAARAQESLTPVDSVISEPEIVMPAVEFTKSSLPKLVTVSGLTEVNHTPEILVSNEEQLVSVVSGVETLTVTELPSLQSSSDADLLANVIALSRELGLESVAQNAQAFVEQVDQASTTVPVVALPQLSVDPEAQQEQVTGGALEQVIAEAPDEVTSTRRKRRPSSSQSGQKGPVRDQDANRRRQEIAADVVQEFAEGHELAVDGKELAEEFLRRAETDPSAKSKIAVQEDGTFGYIVRDVSGSIYESPRSAQQAMHAAIENHTAVAIGPRTEVPEDAVRKVFEGYRSRYASLAA